MRAAYYHAFGNVDRLEVGERPLPQPQAHEVRVKILASAVNPIDWKIRKGMLKWLLRSKLPIITGADFCGVVDKPASTNTAFQKGDLVLGQTSGLTGGASAEYCVLKQDDIILKPDNMTIEEAAGLSLAGQTSYQALIEQAHLQSGQSVLIIGGSGGIGQMAIQIAKATGATVTAVSSQKNHALVRSLGADDVIDYHYQNIRESNVQYDVIYDCVGEETTQTCRGILKKTGVLLSPSPTLKTIFPLLWAKLKHTLFKTPSVYLVLLKKSQSKLKALSTLIKQGKLKVTVDKVFPLEQIRDAHQYSESQRAKGKIIVKI